MVVVEKEYKDSPNDMETINIWADLSSGVVNAQSKTDPKQHVQNVITSWDVAKIRKDAQFVIFNDVNNSEDVRFSFTTEEQQIIVDAGDIVIIIIYTIYFCAINISKQT